MIIIEERRGKTNPKKLIYSELKPEKHIAVAKLISEKGKEFFVDKHEYAFVFSDMEKKFVGRGIFRLKSDFAGVLWVYAEKIPIRVGVRRSSMQPYDIGAYATFLVMISNPNAFAEFLLRKGVVSINELRNRRVIEITADEILKDELIDILRAALKEVLDEGKIDESIFKEKVLEIFEREKYNYDYIQYFSITVAEVGFSTSCKSIDKVLDEIIEVSTE